MFKIFKYKTDILRSSEMRCCVVWLINGNDVSGRNASILYSQMTVSNFIVNAKYRNEVPIFTYNSAPPPPKQMPVPYLKLSHDHFLPTSSFVHYVSYQIHIVPVLRNMFYAFFTLTPLGNLTLSLLKLFIVLLTQQYDVKLSCVYLMKLHVSTPWGHLQAYKI